MRSHRFDFPGSGGHALAARLDLPDGAPQALALFAHCFTCGKDVRAAARIAAGLAREGLGVLRFDFTGLGGSAGDFANTDFTSNVGDLVAAAAHLAATHAAPQLLVGHSLGGAAVLAAAGALPSVRAVATISAPCDTGHVIEQFGPYLEEITARGQAQVPLAGRPFTITRALLDDLREQDQAARIAGLDRALLVLHAPTDTVVGIEHAGRIFQAAKHPKSFVSLSGADHLLSDPRAADYAARVIAAWAGLYLG